MAEVLSLSQGFYDRTVYLYADTAFADKEDVLGKIVLPVDVSAEAVDPFCEVLSTLCSLLVGQEEEQAVSLDDILYDRMVALV